MKYRRLAILPVMLGSILLNCNRTASTDHQLQQAHWLIGTWVTPIPEGPLYETWRAVSPEELAGRSYLVTASDTVTFESIRMVETKGKLYYIPTVQDQNNNQPVQFEATHVYEDELIFENPTHDFPQKIVYTRVASDSLVAVVSGVENGKVREEKFRMKRVQ